MLVRTLLCLLLVNFSSLALAETTNTQLRGPRDTDSQLQQRQLGPLTANDTLWRIAEQIRPNDSVSNYQVMYALMLLNPDAFIDGNLNHLRPGAILTIPDLRAIRQIDAELARRKSEADDRQWAERNRREAARLALKTADTQTNPLLPQLEQLRSDFTNSMQLIESIVYENNQLKDSLGRLETELVALKSQLSEDSLLQQQINLLLQQQAELLAAEQARLAAEAAAAEQSSSVAQWLSSPIGWLLAASLPALLLLFGVLLWVKRRSKASEQVVSAATAEPAAKAGYQSPLPPLDNNDFDDISLFEIDDSLLDDSFNSQSATDSTPEQQLSDFTDDMLLDDDLLGDDLLITDQLEDDLLDTNLLDDVLDDDLNAFDSDTKDPVAETDNIEFDADNILSDSDLNALLLADDDDEEIVDLQTESESSVEITAEVQGLNTARDAMELSSHELSNDELDDLLEEIELDIPLDDEDVSAITAAATATAQFDTKPSLDEAELADAQAALMPSEPEDEEALAPELSADVQLNDEEIALDVNFVEHPTEQPFDSSELDAFAEQLAAETASELSSEQADDDTASIELLQAELEDILQQVESPVALAQNIDSLEDVAQMDELAEPDSEDEQQDATLTNLDLQGIEDESVSRPSEAALSVENPSKMLESYPELDLVDEALSELEQTPFDTMLLTLEQQADALDQADLQDIDTEALAPTETLATVLVPSDEVALMQDEDFVEIDHLLTASEHAEEDSERFNQLNVDVGLAEFADVIGSDTPKDVDLEDAGFAVKLDLIRAYIEIGEQENALQLIDELQQSEAPEHVKAEALKLKASE
ncbi:FimV/HubP family polar landmark protein [Arsukibacterium sp.]|uniref:FimV/HubP family polar landmark protein n=1 Tax=Arsukibacterium sp. TaxID=1977258 RepID=UPI002FD97489